MNNSIFRLVLWIVLLLSAGSLLGLITKNAIPSWYEGLNRSSLTPPNYVFGIAWSILYMMIATSCWWLWEHDEFMHVKPLRRLMAINLLLNWLWTPVFFYLQYTGLALLIIGLLLVSIIAMVRLARIEARPVMWLLTPYLLWVMFALYLNAFIFIYN